MNRRQFIYGIAAGAVLNGSRPEASNKVLLPTISQTEGPFYPVEPIPVTNTLLQGEHLGEKFQVSGRLLKLDGNPIATARIDIWQCDAHGIYRHPRDYRNSKIDSGFRGFASVITDHAGQYNFHTILPVPYTGRPPHIHLMIHTQGKHQLTTQLYLRGKGGPASLQLDLQLASPGHYTANYDLVLNRL